MPNRLAAATSPYLIQHRDNPVDWHEWGDEPFRIASETDRPVLLSVGYSACHWCHVMAHESFEDEATAAYLNEQFVSIKVDREERPDIDRIYMDAVQAMTGHGGWPMTVFLTPKGEPFAAGTYFPKEPRGQMPSFRQVLELVADAWRAQRDQVLKHAARLTEAVNAGIPSSEAPPADTVIERTMATLAQSFDNEWGGFGGAPKFPQAPVLELMVTVAGMEPDRFPDLEPMLRRTLDAMRAGGIYDQVGGGFARYAVDGQWLIPHFEKMLYDNALLATVYLHAGRMFTEPRYLATARETLDYLAKAMRDPSGGIHAAEDADSEGVEGKYYVWSWDEFRETAGADADLIGELYGVTQTGNFEGANHLYLAMPTSELAARHGLDEAEVLLAKERVDAALAEARSRRIRPGRDDKIIAAWNGLALRAFAQASPALNDAGYLEVALGIAGFIENHLIDAEGRLVRSWRGGRASGPAFCVDYGAVAVGLFALYQATSDEHWYRLAERLTVAMVELFGGDEGFFSTATDAGELIARPRDFMDNPLPSANALAAEAISTLAAYTGRASGHLAGITRGAGRLLERAPNAVTHLLGVLYIEARGRRQVAIVGSRAERSALERVFWERYRPDAVLAVGTPDSEYPPLLHGRHPTDSPAAAYVCRDFACDLPATDPDQFQAQLGA